jgi:hypothetical protein
MFWKIVADNNAADYCKNDDVSEGVSTQQSFGL